MLPPGEEFRLLTTTRVYNQLDQHVTDETCGAHAVAAAMETYLVARQQLSPAETLVDPVIIFTAAKRRRSLRRACEAAARGVATPRGVEHATTEYRGSLGVDGMIEELSDRSAPLMIEASVGSDFVEYRNPDIYRAIGPRDLHAMCIVGYGTEAATALPYWIAKNSYGEGWGDGGYVRILWRDPLIEPELTVYTMRTVGA